MRHALSMQILVGIAVSGNYPVGGRTPVQQSRNQRRALGTRETQARAMHVSRGVCAGGGCLTLRHEEQAEVVSIRETMGYDGSLHTAAAYRRLRHCKRRRRHSYQKATTGARAATLVSGVCA